jgi:hypothetical protein
MDEKLAGRAFVRESSPEETFTNQFAFQEFFGLQ